MKEPYQHGEIVLQPIDKIPDSGTTKNHKTFIVAHSESGHHHVLESTKQFKVTKIDKERLYLELFEPAKLVHKKAVDFHPTLPIAPGKYEVYRKTEFNPFDQVINRVKD